MKNISFNEVSEQFIKQLQKGAFLTVKNKDEINTMTIAWGSIGFMWNRPMLTVMVRYSRHSYELIDQNNEFTVSVPAEGQLKEALGFCGTKSGRDFDKFKECGLTLVDNPHSETPFIKECDLHFACKTVYKQAMEPSLLDPRIKEEKYTNHDYHVLYYGEILGAYIEA